MPFDGKIVETGKFGPNITSPRGNNLAKVRISLGISRVAAAKMMGVSVMTLKNWEKGYVKPQRNNWVRMCEVYRASMTQPKFTFNKEVPEYLHVQRNRYKKVKREVIHDCVQQRVRLVKEWY